MRNKSYRYRDLASLASLDKNILTNVCGINRSTIITESDIESSYSYKKHRRDHKRKYLESKYGKCGETIQNHWDHDNCCPNNTTSSISSSCSHSRFHYNPSYSSSLDICSVCNGYIFSDSSSYPSSSSSETEYTRLCQRCHSKLDRELDRRYTDSESTKNRIVPHFKYETLYKKCEKKYRLVDDLRSFYSSSAIKNKIHQKHKKKIESKKTKSKKTESKKCSCSEDDCLHELLGDDVSGLTQIIECKDKKTQDTITLLLANVIVYMQKILKDVQIPDTGNIIRLTIGYLIFYWLGLL